MGHGWQEQSKTGGVAFRTRTGGRSLQGMAFGLLYQGLLVTIPELIFVVWSPSPSPGVQLYPLSLAFSGMSPGLNEKCLCMLAPI